MCHNCDCDPATRKWMGVPLCQGCWEWVLEDNFWEMLDCDGDLLEFQQLMVEVEVCYLRGILDAD